MSLAERAALRLLRLTDPERAHAFGLAALRSGLLPLPGPVTSPRLAVRLGRLDLPNPLGLAAGFDKNAVAAGPLSRAGFGFVETGAATPRPQPGNPRPRVFRLPGAGAVINRYGFNNDGVDAIARRLGATDAAVPVGLNLGANKDSADRAGDFAHVLSVAAARVEFVTVNVSSPNTERLRDLQGPDALAALLDRVLDARADRRPDLPVFLKVAPDLDDAGIAAIARIALDKGIDALVATNTTLARPSGLGPHGDETGGLSGRPLFTPSTRVLARFHIETGGALPLVGVGGIASADDMLTKVRAGATAVQLYTALVYGGLGLVRRILTDLDARLAQDGETLDALRGIDAADLAAGRATA